MKNHLSFLAFVLMVGSAHAQSNLPPCPSSGYFHNCFGTFTYSSGMKYVGEWRDDKYNGQGTLYANGSTRQGIWADGVIIRSVIVQPPLVTNQATNVSPAQAVSFGNLPACQGSNTSYWSNCFGSKTDPSGTTYVGEFKGGKRSGQGTFIFANGNKYVGEWREDKYNGLGTIYASTGTAILEGIWNDDRFVRSAPLLQASIANQSSASAAVQPNIPTSNLPACQGSDVGKWNSCFGTLNLANGDKYEGSLESGKPNGLGTYFYISNNQFKGTKYVGEFKNGNRHGQGVRYAESGAVLETGEWFNNGLIKFYTFNSNSQTLPNSITTYNSTERDRLAAEAEVERKKRQGLEQQLEVAKERDRVTAELDAERKKRQDLEEQLRVAQQSTKPNKQPVTSGIERRVALVIGNSTYRVNPLDNPANDATDITTALNKVGFRTTLIRNATLGQMRDATRKFAEQLQSADVALIYFAGHGIESNRKNYMIPVNADLKFEYELTDQAYDAGSWLEMLETIKSSNSERVNIVILDACRNNNLIGSRSLGRGLGRMDAPTGTFLSYSTAPGKVAADGAKGQRNSPFTRHLLSVIQQPGLQIEEAFKEVRRNVSRDTNGTQVPWESTSLVGKFYFTAQR